MMLTSIDLFFQAKSTHMPVSVEIRNMVNGYPGLNCITILYSHKEPIDINISQDGSSATTFTFDSPVFVNEKSRILFCGLLKLK